jgi:hypothetical protein
MLIVLVVMFLEDDGWPRPTEISDGNGVSIHLARISGLGCLGCLTGRRWPPSALGCGGFGGSAGVGGTALGGGWGGCGGLGAWMPVLVCRAG